MAELTQSHVLASADGWVEVTSVFGIAEGEQWVIEVDGALVEAIVTDTNDAPETTSRGQKLFGSTLEREGDVRINTRENGQYWWLRSVGDSTIIAAPA